MTLQQMLQWGAGWLKEREVPEADLNAWYLFADCFQMERSGYFLHQEEEADAGKEKKFRQMIEKRGQRIPLEYILGYTEFMGLKFKVNSKVLIPRQDTETLVEEALKTVKPGMKVLDMCTGSGCIAISLAVLGKPEQMDAVDLSEKALIQAGKNAKRLGADVSFYRSDMLDEINGRYDVIVSNPPYIASDVVDELMPEVQEHEPRMALDGGADGLDLYRRLLAQAPERLLSGGLLAVEIGYDQREAVMELFREQGFTDVYCDRDLCGNDRVVMGRYQ